MELCQILNISDFGACVQAPLPMKVNRLLPLALDFSETGARIHTTGHVVWTEGSGRVGLRFPELPEISRQQLHRWLDVNMVASPAEPAAEESPTRNLRRPAPRANLGSAPGYTALVAGWAELEREVELLGSNSEAALHLIAERALALTWATGAAISLAKNSGLVCSARAGNDSPELGASLDTHSEFLAACFQSGTPILCNDTALDPGVEPENYAARGIRSLIACPIRKHKGELVGILQVFSAEPAAFWDNDARTLERLARITANAISRTSASHDSLSFSPGTKTESDQAIASFPEVLQHEIMDTTTLPFVRRIALFMGGIAAVILLVWFMSPWILGAMDKYVSPPKSQAAEIGSSDDVSFDYAGMSLDELRKTAVAGNPTAEYILGLRYADADGVRQDYHQALGWFLRSTDAGDPRAAGKIASCFWAGKGAPQDYSKAYFWALLAQAAGDETSRIIVVDSAAHLNQHQRQAEQQEAQSWLRAHHLVLAASSTASR